MRMLVILSVAMKVVIVTMVVVGSWRLVVGWLVYKCDAVFVTVAAVERASL